ncbi:MAG: response regulator [Gemmatimonadaceae bacterium]|nr:response regulator [Gemmatimonadaceae bacterium]
MLPELVPPIISNFGWLLALAVLADLRPSRRDDRRVRTQLVLGLVLGGVVAVTMLQPLRVEPGLVLDSRGIVLAVAGLCLGAIPTLVAAVVGIGVRVFVIGGPAAAIGAIYVAAAAAVGLVAHRHRARRSSDISAVQFATLGAAVGAIQWALAFWLLRNIDTTLRWILLPVLVLANAGGTLALGLLLRRRERRDRQTRTLIEREASFRALAEDLPGVVYRAEDADAGHYTYVSPAVSRFGVTPEQWARAPWAWLETVHPDDRESVRATLSENNAKAQPTRLRYRLLAADGSPRVVEHAAHRVLDENGEPLFAQGVLLDVTESVTLEQQFRHAQKMEGVARLTSGVAHDLNNLLTVINGVVDLSLLEPALTDRTRQDLLELRRTAGRATRLTRQLLSFARPKAAQAGTIEINAELTNILELLTRILGEDVQVDREGHAATAHVRMDAGHFEQVVMNLAVNARDAMPGGGRLTIRTRLGSANENGSGDGVGAPVLLEVSDTGHGMDEATQSRVFEPFFTTKTADKGTGLGLSTVASLVREAGGSIAVSSTLGSGTTFKIIFPTVAAPHRRAAASRAPTPAHSGGRGTVLLVDDEDSIRTVATRVLTHHGFHVIAAADGVEALRVAESCGESLDLLLTDLVMPGVTGPELAAQLGLSRPGLRILFTSGYAEDSITQQFGLTPGPWRFLPKPYGMDELLAAVGDSMTPRTAA